MSINKNLLVCDQTSLGDLSEPLLWNHLVEIPGREWALWRWICLRGSGFPAHLAELLTAINAATLANKIYTLNKAIEIETRNALSAFRAEMNITTDDQRRKQFSRALKQLHKGRITEVAEGPLPQVTQHLQTLHSELQESHARFKEEFNQGTLEVSRKLREIATDPQFQQAVMLQNRDALRRVVHSFARPRRGFKERQNEELVASYIQRYCLKNDTIAFFGPVGWIKFSTKPQVVEMRTGPELLASSSIFFENWCIEAVANKFAENPAVRPWMKPRLLPFFHIEGNRLYSGRNRSSILPKLHLLILERANGELTAREIALSIATAEPQIYKLLEIFAAREIVSWKFEIPLCLHPERYLRRLLENIEDEELKRPLLDALDELENSRNAVAQAFGDAARLNHALQGLEETFSRLTGRAPTKSAGSMYAARTLIYQDCRRDIEIEFGAEIVSSLGPPLSLLLESARWFGYRSAELYRREFERIYGELAKTTANSTVELLEFWSRIELLIFSPSQRLFNQVLSEFQARWEKILNFSPQACRVHYSSDELRLSVGRLFDAPRPGWRLARYHSPDVMIAASDVEAIRRGDYLFVLGEMHITTNTQRFSFAVSQHPSPGELLQAMATDFPESHVLPVPPRQWPRITNRTAMALVSPNDYYLEIARDSIASAPRSRVLPIGSLVLRKTNRGLVIEHRNAEISFDAIEFMGEILSGVAVEMMKIVTPRQHVPRISVDRLVIARESWSFSANELQFVNSEEDHRRFLETRFWMLERGLPRFVFVRVPVEVKPFYLDFDSPVYVEIFCKMVRRMLASYRIDEPITITEMIPTPDQLWLRDAHGHTYTSELRIVAKDLR